MLLRLPLELEAKKRDSRSHSDVTQEIFQMTSAIFPGNGIRRTFVLHKSKRNTKAPRISHYHPFYRYHLMLSILDACALVGFSSSTHVLPAMVSIHSN